MSFTCLELDSWLARAAEAYKVISKDLNPAGVGREHLACFEGRTPDSPTPFPLLSVRDSCLRVPGQSSSCSGTVVFAFCLFCSWGGSYYLSLTTVQDSVAQLVCHSVLISDPCCNSLAQGHSLLYAGIWKWACVCVCDTLLLFVANLNVIYGW